MDDEPKQLIFADRKLGVHTVDIIAGKLAMLEAASMGSDWLYSILSLSLSALARNDHIDLPVAALRADQPLALTEHGRFGAALSDHLCGIGLDLMSTILAPNDQPDTGGGPRTGFAEMLNPEQCDTAE